LFFIFFLLWLSMDYLPGFESLNPSLRSKGPHWIICNSVLLILSKFSMALFFVNKNFSTYQSTKFFSFCYSFVIFFFWLCWSFLKKIGFQVFSECNMTGNYFQQNIFTDGHFQHGLCKYNSVQLPYLPISTYYIYWNCICVILSGFPCFAAETISIFFSSGFQGMFIIWLEITFSSIFLQVDILNVIYTLMWCR
jgi:hypothetical protein